MRGLLLVALQGHLSNRIRDLTLNILSNRTRILTDLSVRRYIMVLAHLSDLSVGLLSSTTNDGLILLRNR